MNPPVDEMAERFLDDYFAECDEHLGAIRRNVLTLEKGISAGILDRAALDELFRSFHTIKGLSGMVGVKEAERLAHRIESHLGALRKGERGGMTASGVEGIILGVNALEGILAARREKRTPPALEAVWERLEGLLAGEGGAPAAPVETAAGKAQAGAGTWCLTFTPSPELAGRGVNVNTVRSLIEKTGRIVRAFPEVLPSGGIAFKFIVEREGPPPPEWETEGLAARQAEAEAPPVEPAAPAGGEEALRAPAALIPSHIVRVDLSRLDEIMRLVGEMVISRARLEEGIRRLEKALPPKMTDPLRETNLAMERQLRDLREAVMRVRMVPVAEIFNRMEFVVRDAAREGGKRVELVVTGQETEIDKLIVERMMDPLLHLVRNAVSHGLETPEEREGAGKDPKGSLYLRARAEGELVVMEVEDDGRGLDMEKILSRARGMGILGEGEEPDGEGLLGILCAPGFSTRDEADLTSGRGVGLAVVRSAVMELKGAMAVHSRPGQGTLFTVRLPLTLAIADAFICAVSTEVFAVPQAVVREVIEIVPERITVMEKNELIPYRGGVLPLIRLGRFFRLGQGNGNLRGLVVGSGTAAAALAVDRVLGRREIVVRALGDPLVQVPGISGATELGDGRVVLILDVNGLLAAARKGQERP